MGETNPWDYWYPKKEGAIEPEIPKLAKLLKRDGFTRILDLGCGTGRHTLSLARAGFKVYGFDISADAIAKTHGALLKENLQATLRVWDMHKPLPYRNAFFDAVISTRVIHHNFLVDIRRLVKEIDRVLRKNGYLFLQIGSYSPEYRRKTVGRDREFDETETRTFIALAGYEKGIPHHDFTREELDELFANYSIEEIHSETDHYSGFCALLRKK
jgi:SAM-dependent methyltransferase